ncbi:MAG: hypothetical protein R2822_05170 [Spirosomataceae bacterium]
MPTSGIITREKARSYNTAFKSYSGVHFSPIQALLGKFVILGSDVRAILAQKMNLVKNVKTSELIRGIGIWPTKAKRKFIFYDYFGRCRCTRQQYVSKEIVLRQNPPGDPATAIDLLSDEHEPYNHLHPVIYFKK